MRPQTDSRQLQLCLGRGLGRGTGGGDPPFSARMPPKMPQGFCSSATCYRVATARPPAQEISVTTIPRTIRETNEIPGKGDAIPSKNDSSLIKPQLYIQFQQINFKIDPFTLKMLNAYAEFIRSDNSYVIREALNYLFSEDAAFCQWLDTRDKKNNESLANQES